MHFLRYFQASFILLGVVSAVALGPRASACTYQVRRAGVAQEIKTIGSHSASDAAAIPLAPLASRTFFITPSELGGGVTLPPINVGVTAETIRADLVTLATILNAGVPANSVSYTNNANGTVTVDFIQTDRVVLPRSSVREIHEFNQSSCQITKITGYVHGNVICPTDSSNTVLQNICNSLKAARSGS